MPDCYHFAWGAVGCWSFLKRFCSFSCICFVVEFHSCWKLVVLQVSFCSFILLLRVLRVRELFQAIRFVGQLLNRWSPLVKNWILSDIGVNYCHLGSCQIAVNSTAVIHLNGIFEFVIVPSMLLYVDIISKIFLVIVYRSAVLPDCLNFVLAHHYVVSFSDVSFLDFLDDIIGGTWVKYKWWDFSNWNWNWSEMGARLPIFWIDCCGYCVGAVIWFFLFYFHALREADKR